MKDIAGASPDSPAVLRITQYVFAGDPPGRAVGPGEAAQVATGVPLPAGTICVVGQEDCATIEDSGDNLVKNFRRHKKHDNFCFSGEDLHRGQLIVAAGDRLNGKRHGYCGTAYRLNEGGAG